ncbi:2-hydroxyacyl-CoA dehydratase [bacterium]|nr:2-hydroxyacyl-CoA dehydratase [bacterium]MCI0607014.1 2-hydroxyacyl-CoA dehydratase [bacterium]
MALQALIETWKDAIYDPAFEMVEQWKEKTGRKAVGYFPVYSPVEILHAAGLLPVAIFGAGNRLEITNADSRFGSFICSIAKSTMELGLQHRLDLFSGMLFHSICDTARNLAFLFKRNFHPQLFVEYIHLPQNNSTDAAVDYLTSEYKRVAKNMADLAGREFRTENLEKSILLYNNNRRCMRRLYYALRSDAPHLLSTSDFYLLGRAGCILPPEEHSLIVSNVIEELSKNQSKTRDRIRVVLEGSFCEQPPLELLAVLEDAGCYVVNDDLLLGLRWFEQDLEFNHDPFRSLARSYLHDSCYSSVRHDCLTSRSDMLLEKVRKSRADAVIFCIAKFCEPAYFDYVLFKNKLDENNIPHLLVEFEEKMRTFEKARTEVETFVESILFD